MKYIPPRQRTPNDGGSNFQGQLRYLDAVIVILILISLIIVLLTYGTDQGWVGHALLALIGLGLLVSTVAIGPVLSGRIKKGRDPNTFRTHRRLGIWSAIFLEVTFFYGIIVADQTGTPFLSSIHGPLGAAIAVLIAIQVVPSLVVKGRKRIRRAHMVLGFTLLILVILQVAYGLYMAVIP